MKRTIMKRSRSASCLALLGYLSVGACAADEPERTDAPESLAQLDESQVVRAVDLTDGAQDEFAEAGRIQRFGKLLLGEELTPYTLQRALRASAGEPTGGVPGEDTQGLRITRIARTHDLLVVRGALADDHASAVDVGEEAARRVFDETVATLTREGAPEVRGLDLSKVRSARIEQAAGRLGDPTTLKARVKQYLFTAPRTVHGVPVLDASFTVGVHRGGALASLRTTGVVTNDQGDSRPSARRARRASPAYLRDRLALDFPAARVHPLGLAYVPTLATRGAPAGPTEPREVYVVFPPLSGGEGRARGMRVAYSVTDPSSPALVLDATSARDQGDARR